jgi:hypothetical protein
LVWLKPRVRVTSNCHNPDFISKIQNKLN